MNKRIEKDFLGEKLIDKDAYYGIWSLRAKENFNVSGIKLQKEFLRNYVRLKKCCAKANYKDGKLKKEIFLAIVKACDEILNSDILEKNFLVDIFQAGAGTSTNMNINEIIANKALEILNYEKGNYNIVHPNDHVNASQSTNDTFPTVSKITLYFFYEKLLNSIKLLEKSLQKKSLEFKNIIKLGRTHLQDALPISLGSEFSAYYYSILNCEKRLIESSKNLLNLPIGATAIGTSVNASKKYIDYVIEEIRKEFGKNFKIAENFYYELQFPLDFLDFANSLILIATSLTKICNDLRILSSGPRGGIGEIILPEVQGGSSIMPGKVNPSILEMVNMVCFDVIGNCNKVLEASLQAQLDLNVFLPISIYNLLFSTEILSNSIKILVEKCIDGIKVNEKRIKENLEKSLSLITLISEKIGYQKAAEIAREAYEKNKTIKEIILEKNILSKEEIEKIFKF